MAKSKEEHCSNCAAYISTEGDGGECHRNAPLAQMDGAMRNIREIQTCWPYVESSDWCYSWIAGKEQSEPEEEE